MEDAGGNEMENEMLPVHHDGVPGVGAPLVADDHIRPASEKVHDLPLAFIAPLAADNRENAHGTSPRVPTSDTNSAML